VNEYGERTAEGLYKIFWEPEEKENENAVSDLEEQKSENAYELVKDELQAIVNFERRRIWNRHTKEDLANFLSGTYMIQLMV